MAFAVGFGIFALLMVVLAVFVIRFSIQLGRDRPGARNSSPGARPRPGGTTQPEERDRPT
ncbi:MAG: hypothetical protein ACLQK4_01070 [Acidimicrobiales bacterium]